MAGREDIDPTGSTTEQKPVLKENTEVVNGQYISPDWESLRMNKGVAKQKLVKCDGSGNCTLPAIVRPDFKDKGPKNLCQRHWDKVKHNVDSYEPGPMYLTRDLDLAADIRGEDAVATKQGKSRAAASIFDVTGAYIHLQGPGRPIKTESEKAEEEMRKELGGSIDLSPRPAALPPVDHVTPVIEKASVGGGHYPVDHFDKIDLAQKALAHAIWSGGGVVDKDVYHSKAAELGITDENERNKYFIHAMNKNIKDRGVARAIPGVNMTDVLSREVESNPTTISPNVHDDYADLMGSDIPSARDVGLSKGESLD